MLEGRTMGALWESLLLTLDYTRCWDCIYGVWQLDAYVEHTSEVMFTRHISQGLQSLIVAWDIKIISWASPLKPCSHPLSCVTWRVMGVTRLQLLLPSRMSDDGAQELCLSFYFFQKLTYCLQNIWNNFQSIDLFWIKIELTNFESSYSLFL